MNINPVRWWNRLTFRLTVPILLVTIATLGFVMWMAVRAQERHLEHHTIEGAALFSDAIRLSTHEHMLLDQRADVYRTITAVGQQDNVTVVRIFNKEGRVTFSTDRDEIGTMVDKRAESCYACHTENQPLVRLPLKERSRVYRRNGTRVLGMVTPIYNEPSCWNASCHAHPREQRVLGVVDVGLSLASLDSSRADMQREALTLGILATLVVGGIVFFLTRRSVVRPVGALVRGTCQLALGDLNHRVPVKSDDELGRLAESFNEMAATIAQARADRLKLLESLESQVAERTAALQQATARMISSEKLSSLGKLAASVAHEINNPLAGILTYAKLLVRVLDSGALDDRSRTSAVRQLRLIQRESERCTAIVRNLLDFARQREPELREMDVRACVDEALSLVAHQCQLQGVALEPQLEPCPLIEADFGQIRQALVNVLMNACEAMPGGGRIGVHVAPSVGGGVVIRIEDNGPGIPPDLLTKVLDPFFTTKEMGTGLGLSVVFGIVERHGGRLDIASTVGEGTRVTIELPPNVPDGADRPRAEALAAAAGRNGPPPGR